MTDGRSLHFRALEPGDEHIIFPEVDEKLTEHWIGWEPAKDIDEERARIGEKILLNKTPPNFESIALDRDGRFVGCCGISPAELPGEFEINIWVAHSQQQRGYGRFMLDEVIRQAKTYTSLLYLIYSCTEGNEGSRKIIERAGGILYRTLEHEKRGKLRLVFDYKIFLRS